MQQAKHRFFAPFLKGWNILYLHWFYVLTSCTIIYGFFFSWNAIGLKIYIYNTNKSCWYVWFSQRIHRKFKFTVVNVKDECYLASSWIYTMNEELFSKYFTEGNTRMIGIILCVNSWISKHCSQYRSDFQH